MKISELTLYVVISIQTISTMTSPRFHKCFLLNSAWNGSLQFDSLFLLDVQARSMRYYYLPSDKALFWLFSLKETKDLNFLFGFPQQFYLDDKK